tara:strand:- start:403 stop:663 length:261 start_codon:yes stop_codon:yes gene_type:complete
MSSTTNMIDETNTEDEYHWIAMMSDDYVYNEFNTKYNNEGTKNNNIYTIEEINNIIKKNERKQVNKLVAKKTKRNRTNKYKELLMI